MVQDGNSSFLWRWERRIQIDIGMWTSPAIWEEFQECGPRTPIISIKDVDSWTSPRVYWQGHLLVKEDGLSAPHTSLVSHPACQAVADLTDTSILVSLMQDLHSLPPPPVEHSGVCHSLLRGQNSFLWGFTSHQQLCNLHPQIIFTSQVSKA